MENVITREVPTTSCGKTALCILIEATIFCSYWRSKEGAFHDCNSPTECNGKTPFWTRMGYDVARYGGSYETNVWIRCSLATGYGSYWHCYASGSRSNIQG